MELTKVRQTATKLLSLVISLALVLAFTPITRQQAFADTAAPTFTASVSGTQVADSDIVKTADGFSYTGWDGSAVTMDLYTVTVPAGTTSVDLTFSANVIAYAYTSGGTYVSSYMEDFNTGATSFTATVDSNYIQVQSPYAGTYDSTNYYAIHFVEASAVPTFTATVAGTQVADSDIVKTADGFSYTGWDGSAVTMDLYTVTVPAGTTSVDLTFSANVIAYAYTSDGTYVSSYVEDYNTGATSFAVTVDSNYIQVQSPYAGTYDSTNYYAIAFTASSDPESTPSAVGDVSNTGTLITNIAASWGTGVSADWKAFDLARGGFGSQVDSTAIAANATAALEKSLYSTDIQRTALAMLATGQDASAQLEKIAGLPEDAGVSSRIFSVLAYAAAGKSATEAQSLIDMLLTNQLDNGGFAYYSDTFDSTAAADPDMTAMAICALQPYAASSDTVAAALEKATAALKSMQLADGSFGYMGATSGNANSTAMAVIALCALGINPATDSAWIPEGGASPLAMLIGQANDTLTAFKYADTDNELATEQGFRALVAYQNFVNSGKAYNVYTQAYQAPASSDSSTAKSTKTPATGDTTGTVATALILAALASGVALTRRIRQ